MSFMTFFAQIKIDKEEIGYNTPITSDANPLENILNLVYFTAGIASILVMVTAGYLFVTSRGDPNQMKRSKDAIRGAVIGLFAIIAAFAVTQFVLGGLRG